MFISDAYAAAAPALTDSNSLAGTVIQLALILLIFYFLLIRPMKKREAEHNTMVEALKAGDNVVTNGGIHGIVAKVNGMQVELEIAPNVVITVERMAVSGVIQPETKKESASKKSVAKKTSAVTKTKK
jgi:preprotein translocase subunit YajC